MGYFSLDLSKFWGYIFSDIIIREEVKSVIGSEESEREREKYQSGTHYLSY